MAASVNDSLWFLDTHVVVRVSHRQGRDQISVLEHRAPPGHSPPLHIHHTEDEMFHVLAGDFRFLLGGQEHRLGPGAFLLAPKGVPHHFKVESAQGGRWLTVTAHSHFEEFVRTVSRPAPSAELPPPHPPPSPETAAQLAAVAAGYHIELIGPPLD
jgi:quercetin dioxygenase-like cupin family protein